MILIINSSTIGFYYYITVPISLSTNNPFYRSHQWDSTRKNHRNNTEPCIFMHFNRFVSPKKRLKRKKGEDPERRRNSRRNQAGTISGAVGAVAGSDEHAGIGKRTIKEKQQTPKSKSIIFQRPSSLLPVFFTTHMKPPPKTAKQRYFRRIFILNSFEIHLRWYRISYNSFWFLFLREREAYNSFYFQSCKRTDGVIEYEWSTEEMLLTIEKETRK